MTKPDACSFICFKYPSACRAACLGQLGFLFLQFFQDFLHKAYKEQPSTLAGSKMECENERQGPARLDNYLNIASSNLIGEAKMAKRMLLTVIVKEEDKGYSILCPGLNVASQGETFEESISNIKEAIELYIESAEQLGIMDDVLDQLGISKTDFRKGKMVSRTVTANVPIEVTI